MEERRSSWLLLCFTLARAQCCVVFFFFFLLILCLEKQRAHPCLSTNSTNLRRALCRKGLKVVAPSRLRLIIIARNCWTNADFLKDLCWLLQFSAWPIPASARHKTYTKSRCSLEILEILFKVYVISGEYFDAWRVACVWVLKCFFPFVLLTMTSKNLWVMLHNFLSRLFL